MGAGLELYWGIGRGARFMACRACGCGMERTEGGMRRMESRRDFMVVLCVENRMGDEIRIEID